MMMCDGTSTTFSPQSSTPDYENGFQSETGQNWFVGNKMLNALTKDKKAIVTITAQGTQGDKSKITAKFKDFQVADDTYKVTATRLSGDGAISSTWFSMCSPFNKNCGISKCGYNSPYTRLMIEIGHGDGPDPDLDCTTCKFRYQGKCVDACPVGT